MLHWDEIKNSFVLTISQFYNRTDEIFHMKF